MEEQNKPMKSEDEEKWNRYWNKLKENSRKVMETKDMKELISEGRAYAIRGFLTGDCGSIEQMAALALAATFKKRKENSF